MSIEMNANERMFNYAKKLGFGELHFKLDAATNLFAVVAIHSTKLGPALGGCRFREYASIDDAVEDAVRLASGMSYKAAITGLPLGGGKSVLMKPKNIDDREAYFKAFGKFVNDLNGRYITAMDSGTIPTDMDAIATQTRFVTSTSAGGDPSPCTARGVFLAIKAAVKHKLGRDELAGIKVALQGVGNVGLILAKHLHEADVELIVTDTNKDAVNKCVKDFGVKAVGLDEIYGVDCDIFAPCALGAIINDESIPQLKASMVVGSANNQLAEPRHGSELHKRGILYAPDYVANAGGLVHACAQFYNTPMKDVEDQVNSIYGTSMAIFERSAKENISTHIIADKIAEERLNNNSNNTKQKQLDKVI